jgi:hypothetical protein
MCHEISGDLQWSGGHTMPSKSGSASESEL